MYIDRPCILYAVSKYSLLSYRNLTILSVIQSVKSMPIRIQLQHKNGNVEMKFIKCSIFCMNYSKSRADLKMNSDV